AVKLLEEAIAEGAAKDGWAALGALYQRAEPSRRDLAGAAAAYEKAAALGDPWSLISLAEMLQGGDGVPVDTGRAEELLQAAAAIDGDARSWAWSRLGDLYREADGAQRDPAGAVDAYRQAIDLGNTSA